MRAIKMENAKPESIIQEATNENPFMINAKSDNDSNAKSEESYHSDWADDNATRQRALSNAEAEPARYRPRSH